MKFLKHTLAVIGVILFSSVIYFNFPPPNPAHAQFSQQGWAGMSGGAANAQTLTIANYNANLVGVPISFVAGFTNTGPTTININGLGAVSLFRSSSIGPTTLSGSELVLGEAITIMYTGTVYQIISYVDTTPIGATVQFRGSNTPRGTLIEDGSCVSRTTYASLFSVIGTTYGACDGSTTFAVPDSRGTSFTALDNQGANGAANRITSGGSGCNATAVGICGQQNNQLITANLPPYTPSGTVGISDPGHNHTLTDPGHNHTFTNTSTNLGVSPGSGATGIAGQGSAFTGGNFTGISLAANVTGITAGFTGAAQGGTSATFTNLMPISIGRRAIKY